jgi:arylsulfatase A-like enzyme
MVYDDASPRCMALDLKILPEKLKELGYATHLIGK